MKFKMMDVPDVSLRLNKIANLASVLSEALTVRESFLREGACWILGDIEDLANEIEEVLYGNREADNDDKKQ